METYIEYNFNINPVTPWQEILLAELSLYEFETFEETPDGLKAYIQEKFDKENLLSDLLLLNNKEVKVTYSKTVIPPVNWNKEWESNFNPISVENKCYVRAEFHAHDPNYEYEIIIQPKMSFGTGHHQTTYLMLQYLLELDLKKKVVMDMGCGTGILAILAKKRGAAKTYGIDYDSWAIENADENKERNQVEINFYLGEVEKLTDLNLFYDCFIANINKNILLRDIPQYSQYINSGGDLLLSGILDIDFEDIITVCKKNNFSFIEKKQKDNWISLHLKKNF